MNDEHGAKLADFPKGIQYYFERGEALFRLGERCPKRAWDQNGIEILGITEKETYLYMGWLCARGVYELKCRKVEDILRPDPNEPRPRKAA